MEWNKEFAHCVLHICIYFCYVSRASVCKLSTNLNGKQLYKWVTVNMINNFQGEFYFRKYKLPQMYISKCVYLNSVLKTMVISGMKGTWV